jgi:RHS repeat-associated protein
MQKRTLFPYGAHRWYDPQAGRWISQDPIGFTGGDINLYRYTKNAPTNFLDPSGLQLPNNQLQAIITVLQGNLRQALDPNQAKPPTVGSKIS